MFFTVVGVRSDTNGLRFKTFEFHLYSQIKIIQTSALNFPDPLNNFPLLVLSNHKLKNFHSLFYWLISNSEMG